MQIKPLIKCYAKYRVNASALCKRLRCKNGSRKTIIMTPVAVIGKVMNDFQEGGLLMLYKRKTDLE